MELHETRVFPDQPANPQKSGGFFSSEDQIEVFSKQADYSIDFGGGDRGLVGKAAVHSQNRFSGAVPVRPRGVRSPRLNEGLFKCA